MLYIHHAFAPLLVFFFPALFYACSVSSFDILWQCTTRVPSLFFPPSSSSCLECMRSKDPSYNHNVHLLLTHTFSATWGSLIIILLHPHSQCRVWLGPARCYAVAMWIFWDYQHSTFSFLWLFCTTLLLFLSIPFLFFWDSSPTHLHASTPIFSFPLRTVLSNHWPECYSLYFISSFSCRDFSIINLFVFFRNKIYLHKTRKSSERTKESIIKKSQLIRAHLMLMRAEWWWVLMWRPKTRGKKK